jgi:hypothetical protein
MTTNETQAYFNIQIRNLVSRIRYVLNNIDSIEKRKTCTSNLEVCIRDLFELEQVQQSVLVQALSICEELGDKGLDGHHCVDEISRKFKLSPFDKFKGLSTAERFALDEWLSDYPEGQSYEEILKLILVGSDEVTVWEVAESYPEYQIVEMIDATFSHFSGVTKDLATA